MNNPVFWDVMLFSLLDVFDVSEESITFILTVELLLWRYIPS
jgi:hypothetical protein